MAMWTDKDIERTSKINGWKIEAIYKNLEKYTTDLNHDRRVKIHRCKYCFYFRGSQIVTQAFANYTCSHCQKVFVHHNGGIPRLCEACAKELNVCQECGAKMD